LASEEKVRNLKPNMEKLKALDGLLLHVTAKGKEFDCVSRSFAPKLNVPEDPVCGSGHCHIIPFWAEMLGKNDLVAYQASSRGGTIYCEYQGDRVKMSGKATLYSTADINF
ncbi:MAG: PhzF family phenazine biosynthesis protein, partial [Clostridiaceae bacterium]|nr:PhzF family phenazine biosynthesis protein [Clostridiaceae bacterium]